MTGATPASLIIFDCDGVLVDSERVANRAFTSLLNDIGLPFTLEDTLRTFVGNSMPRCVEIIAERLGHAPPEDLLARYHTMSRAALAAELVPDARVHAMLDAFDGAGVPYAVASNGEHAKMETTLAATGLRERFVGRRFSAADVEHPKPAPDVYLQAARVLGHEPASCVVLEDTPLGIAAGRAAGMYVVGFVDLIDADRLREAGAQHVVTTHDAFRNYIGALRNSSRH